MLTHYETLGISSTAKPEQIKSSYRALVKRFHPDLFPGGSEAQAQAGERLIKINAAYSVLSNPQKRAAYDTRLTRARSSSGAQPEYCGKCGKPTLYWQVGRNAPMCRQCGSRAHSS
ncbi:MAG: J domain-containing protein [Acidobacteriota bacterium]